MQCVLSKAATKYDYLLVIGDINIDVDMTKTDIKGYLSNLCDTFNLTNIINKKTCTKKSEGSSLDVFLTTHPKCFQKTCVTETGLSDFHKLISSFLKSRYQRLPAKNIIYRDYKHFNEKN